MTVKLSSALPKDVTNGLDSIEGQLVNEPDSRRIVLAVVSTKKITIDTDSGESVPTAQIRAIEPLNTDSADAKELVRILKRAVENRLGSVPADLQDDIAAFTGATTTNG